MVGLTHHCILFSQTNLVLNWDAENYLQCPSAGSGDLNNDVVDWYDPLNGLPIDSPDYMHPCSSDANFSTPTNGFGYQIARSGVAYIHSGIYLTFNNNFYAMEPFAGKLSSTLEKDKIYQVKFYLSMSNFSNISIDAFDISFSEDSIYITNPHGLSNIIMINQPGNIINDTVNWVEISTCFKANGTENHFIIGALRDTNLINIEFNTFCDPCVASYIFDDFSIYECDTCCLDEFPIEEYINIFPNPGNAQNVNVFVSNDNTSKIELFDATGKLVWQNKFQEFYQNTSLPVLAQGVYLWRYISSTGFNKTGKIITIK